MVAKANTSKDVVIRFTGENLTAPVIEKVKQGYRNLGREVQGYARDLTNSLNKQWEAQKRAANEAIRAAQTVSKARIKAAEIEAREIQRIHNEGARKRFEMIRMSERLAVSNRDRWMDPFINPEENRGWVMMGGGEQKRATRTGRFGAAAKKGAAAFGLVGGSLGDSIGGTTGRVVSGAGSVAGAATMGGMVGGPWGAAIFGGIEALKQFTGAINDAAEAARNQRRANLAAQAQAVAESEARVEEVRDMRRGLVPDRQVTRGFAARKLGDQLRLAKEREEAARQLQSSDLGILTAERYAIEQQVGMVGQNATLSALGRAGRNALGSVTGAAGDLFGMARNAAQPGLLSAQRNIGMLMQNARLNMDVRSQTASPAEALRNQLGELEGMKSRLSPENYERRRKQIYLSGIGQLPSQQETPGLTATTGRFITRGPEQKQAEELSAFRREQKEAQREVNRNLLAILREMRDGGDAGGI